MGKSILAIFIKLKLNKMGFFKKDGKIEILAKSNKSNQNKVIAILQKMGY